ncbi:RsfA family transcriptional regulator [Massilibacterium senegalense]|uniref:RsfA family transcriptional regulator n=1 Tax=Massilibacterium senegalense TaxID=1632858 RepID=UPI000781C9F0|nr:RsfA family transcriptional regulator [Massilibacterium senegalense]
MKVRQDAWTEENDLLLAETVLRHIREGSTQLNAFEEVGDVLNRTSAACGFRWNAVVRNDYTEAIELAKKQRKERKRKLKQQQEVASSYPVMAPTIPVATEQPSSTMTLHDIIQFLQQLDYDSTHTTTLKVENDQLMMNNRMMQERISLLEQEKEKLEHDYQTIQEDYQSFMEIMERARKMVLFTEEEPKTTFRMEKNGNLEKLAK